MKNQIQQIPLHPNSALFIVIAIFLAQSPLSYLLNDYQQVVVSTESFFLWSFIPSLSLGLPLIVMGIASSIYKNKFIENFDRRIGISFVAMISAMSLDIALRFGGITGSDIPLSSAYIVLKWILVAIWIFGSPSLKLSSKSLFVFLSAYLAVSYWSDFIGIVEAWQYVEFYDGFIDWLSWRFRGLATNGNTLASATLFAVTLFALSSRVSKSTMRWDVLVTILLLALCFFMRGRNALTIGAILLLVWIYRYGGWHFKLIRLGTVSATWAAILLSLQFSALPLSSEMPFINTNPSLYRIPHVPNFRMAVAEGLVGKTYNEQVQNFPKYVDETLINEVFDYTNNEHLRNTYQPIFSGYLMTHSFFLSTWLEHGLLAFLSFLTFLSTIIYGYIKRFRYGYETQILLLSWTSLWHLDFSFVSLCLIYVTAAHLRNGVKE